MKRFRFNTQWLWYIPTVITLLIVARGQILNSNQLNKSSKSSTNPHVVSPGIDKFTEEQFDATQTGMTLQQVQKIMGSSGKRTSSILIEEGQRDTYGWKNPQVTQVFMTFSNEFLVEKSMSNQVLNKTSFTDRQFDLIQQGMTIQQAQQVMSSQGTRMKSRTDFDNSFDTSKNDEYVWENYDDMRIRLSFSNGFLKNKILVKSSLDHFF